jgi:hypothetical protein
LGHLVDPGKEVRPAYRALIFPATSGRAPLRRTGFYLAVLEEGLVTAGDSIELLARDEHGVTVADIVNLYTADATNQDLLRRASITRASHRLARPLSQEFFLVNVLLPNGALFRNVLANCADIGTADLLIGMDIITSGELIIMARDGGILSSFRCPSNDRHLGHFP